MSRPRVALLFAEHRGGVALWGSRRGVTEPQIVRPKAKRAITARGKPRLGSTDKLDSFGLRREMLLRIAAIEKMIPTLRGLVTICGNRAAEIIELIP